MNEKQLQLFIELASQRSFSQTAYQLNVSQSTVTKQLQSLEHELGSPLIQRQTVSLTEEGLMVYEKAKSLLTDWQQLRSVCQSRGNKYTETLSVGASTTPGTYFLPSLCKECHYHYPNWRLHLHIEDSSTVLSLLTEKEIDVAIVGVPTEQSNIVSQKFQSDRLAIVAPPGENRHEIDGFSELPSHAFVKRPQASGTYQAVETGLKQWGGSLAELETAAIVPNTESLLSLVEAGIGYGFLSEYALNAALKRDCVFKGILPYKRQFYLAFRKENQEKETIKAFKKLAESRS
ncbi:DNA-binding transcriptional LysR family regulator [Salibacterium salarium]|uniref:selenium metabolism-associated LysR family transcriptional regulator n=1 Tax=Salibacterium salarium TaxID=284579 RepID=UPI00278AD79B|nr:selenium metabolism-associated LysR family transcriptional regulator [Salibacterium salarium]MDQ0299236.1 DNA-binding transcriptional LysR family regulator [Salibacterium salarium]